MMNGVYISEKSVHWEGAFEFMVPQEEVLSRKRTDPPEIN